MNFYPLGIYVSPELLTFCQKKDVNDRVDLAFLGKQLRSWPYNKHMDIIWKMVMDKLRNRMDAILDQYFASPQRGNEVYKINSYLQQVPMDTEDCNEILGILSFFETFVKEYDFYVSKRIYKTLYRLLFCVNPVLRVKALKLIYFVVLKKHQHKQLSICAKIQPLFLFSNDEKIAAKSFTFNRIEYHLKDLDIYNLNNKLKNTHIDKDKYIEMWLQFTKLQCHNTFVTCKYIFAYLVTNERVNKSLDEDSSEHSSDSIGARSSSEDISENATYDNQIDQKLMMVLKKSFLELSIMSYAVKTSVVCFYTEVLLVGMNTKMLFKGLQFGNHSGYFIKELKNIYSKDISFIESFFLLTTECMIEQVDYIDVEFYVEIINIFTSILQINADKKWKKNVLNSKIRILETINILLRDRYEILSSHIITQKMHSIITNELESLIKKVKLQDYKKSMQKGITPATNSSRSHQTYIGSLLLSLVHMYDLSYKMKADYGIEKITESKNLQILLYTLENHRSFDDIVIYRVMTLFVNHLKNTKNENTFFDNNNTALDCFFRMFSNPPKNYRNIKKLITLLNVLSHNDKYRDMLIKKNFLHGVFMTLIKKEYMYCFSPNLGKDICALITDHEPYRKVVFEEISNLLAKLNGLSYNEKEVKNMVVKDLFTVLDYSDMSATHTATDKIIPLQIYIKHVAVILEQLFEQNIFSESEIRELTNSVINLLTTKHLYADFDVHRFFWAAFDQGSTHKMLHKKFYELFLKKYAEMIDNGSPKAISRIQNSVSLLCNECKLHKTLRDTAIDDVTLDDLYNYVLMNRILFYFLRILHVDFPYPTEVNESVYFRQYRVVEKIYTDFLVGHKDFFFEYDLEFYLSDWHYDHYVEIYDPEMPGQLKYTYLMFELHNNSSKLFFKYLKSLETEEQMQAMQYIISSMQTNAQEFGGTLVDLKLNYRIVCELCICVNNESIFSLHHFIPDIINLVEAFCTTYSYSNAPQTSTKATKYVPNKWTDSERLCYLTDLLASLYAQLIHLILEKEHKNIAEQPKNRLEDLVDDLNLFDNCKINKSRDIYFM